MRCMLRSDSDSEREACVLPIRVRNNSKTTGGPISGKINAKVLAKATASIQQAIAKSGLYVLGYVAITEDQVLPTICEKWQQYLGSAAVVSLPPFPRSGPVAIEEAEARATLAM